MIRLYQVAQIDRSAAAHSPWLDKQEMDEWKQAHGGVPDGCIVQFFDWPQTEGERQYGAPEGVDPNAPISEGPAYLHARRQEVRG